jgi:hypothetical protein
MQILDQANRGSYSVPEGLDAAAAFGQGYTLAIKWGPMRILREIYRVASSETLQA